MIGLGYLEKNYGKDATEITEISLQGLLRTFFRLTSETSDNTLASVLRTVFRLTSEISETSQCIYCVMLRILRRFLGDISDNSFLLTVSRKRFMSTSETSESLRTWWSSLQLA